MPRRVEPGRRCGAVRRGSTFAPMGPRTRDFRLSGERRAGARRALRLELRARAGSASRPLRGHTLNISETGALIVLAGAVELGTLLELEIHVPGDPRPLVLEALAVREPEGSPGPPRAAFGVSFVSVPPAERRRLRELLYEDSAPVAVDRDAGRDPAPD
ncbi:MAG: PilZ domain-containing protein [Acidobacteria bacterium]|nr:MAG: PilZ domain-containing protein [Acidobacteriota bacterium]